MAEADEDPIENTPGYVAPKKVALDDLKNLDKDDEALNRWKAALLAGGSGWISPCMFLTLLASAGGDPRKVIVEKMSFVTAGRDDIVLDLTSTFVCRTIESMSAHHVRANSHVLSSAIHIHEFVLMRQRTWLD